MRVFMIVLILSCAVSEGRFLNSSSPRIRRSINPIRERLRSLLRSVKEGQLDDIVKNVTEAIVKGFKNVKDSALIYPGTKWCGAGNVAKHFEDFGIKFEADKCCRDHDHCFDHIPGSKDKYGLANKNSYTMSHCDCEKKFIRCLKKADTIGALTIGFTYFNILRPKCFIFEHPVKDCVKYGQRYPKTEDCQEHVFDFSRPKQWQILDALDWRGNI